MSGRGKGKKGLGKGGAKRHRKLFRDNIQGITKPALRRLARRGGVKRIGGNIYEETRGILKIFLEDVIGAATTYTDYAKRKTVSAADVVHSLRRKGHTLYGYGGEAPEPPRGRKRTRVQATAAAVTATAVATAAPAQLVEGDLTEVEMAEAITTPFCSKNEQYEVEGIRSFQDQPNTVTYKYMQGPQLCAFMIVRKGLRKGVTRDDLRVNQNQTVKIQGTGKFKGPVGDGVEQDPKEIVEVLMICKHNNFRQKHTTDMLNDLFRKMPWDVLVLEATNAAASTWKKARYGFKKIRNIKQGTRDIKASEYENSPKLDWYATTNKQFS